MFWERGEKFLVISFSGDKDSPSAEVNAVKADFSAKKLKTNKYWKVENDSQFKQIKRIAERVFYPKPYRIILALSSRVAATIYTTVPLTREIPGMPISEADLDNLIAQALWKVFDENRSQSAKKLNVNDVDIVLADNRIYEIRIDGKITADPVGGKGRNIEIYFSQTFTLRDFLRPLRWSFPKRASFALTAEAGALATHLTSRFSDNKKFIFASVGADETCLFMKTPDKIAFFDNIKWGNETFYGSVAKDLAIDAETTKKISSLSHSNQKIHKLFAGEFSILTKGLKMIADRARVERVYVASPVFIFSSNSPKIIVRLENDGILKSFGFKLKSSSRNINFLNLASILEFNFIPHDDLVNHLAGRRIRWLVPAST